MSLRLKRGLTVIAAIIALAACSTVGQGNLDAARDALKNNQPATALAAASRAILENPKFDAAKTFIRDNFETANQSALAYLAQTEQSAAPVDLEKRYLIYSDLKAFYDNLQKIGLPIAADAKFFGLIKSWEWTTQIIDYSSQKEAARAAGREGTYAAGVAAITSGDLDSANGLMSKVVGLFAVKDSEEQKEDYRKISENFQVWADGFQSSNEPDSLLKALDAYALALKYNSANGAASDGQAVMKSHLSDVYLTQGLNQERMGGIDSLKNAIASFKNALKYNGDNTEAADGIPRAQNTIAELLCDEGAALERSGRIDDMIAAHGKYKEALEWNEASQRAQAAFAAVTERIAEYYYQDGVRLGADFKNADSVDKAVAAFTEAEKWIPNYKDATVRSRRLYVSREVLILEAKLGQTQGEFDRTQARVNALSAMVNKANTGMDDLNFVADKVVQLDQQMLVLSKTASALGGIPIVGSVITVAGTAMGYVHKPVKAVSAKIGKLRAPVITPAREAIAKVKAGVDKVVSTMDSIRSNLDYVRKILIKLDACLLKVDNAAVIKEVEADVKEINKIMDKLNKGLDTVNDVQDKSEATLKAIAESVSVVSSVKSGIEKVMKPLDKIKGITDEVYDVLKKKIKIPFVGSFTVEQAISSTTGVVKKAAEAILNPVLKKLNIDFPSIPGIDKFEQIIDQVEGYYQDVKSAMDKITGVADQILDVPNQLKARGDAILSKAGCSI